jgi:hypothetical protein
MWTPRTYHAWLRAVFIILYQLCYHTPAFRFSRFTSSPYCASRGLKRLSRFVFPHAPTLPACRKYSTEAVIRLLAAEIVFTSGVIQRGGQYYYT